MRYPVAIETGSRNTTFGVVVPDLPGCFSAGDTIDEAMANVEDAIDLWIEAALDAGRAIPAPSTLDAMQARQEFAGWTFALVTIDPGRAR